MVHRAHLSDVLLAAMCLKSTPKQQADAGRSSSGHLEGAPCLRSRRPAYLELYDADWMK